jgi:hypothetical protein
VVACVAPLVIDPDQLVLLIAEAQDAESIDGGTVDLLNSQRHWRPKRLLP